MLKKVHDQVIPSVELLSVNPATCGIELRFKEKVPEELERDMLDTAATVMQRVGIDTAESRYAVLRAVKARMLHLRKTGHIFVTPYGWGYEKRGSVIEADFKKGKRETWDGKSPDGEGGGSTR